MTELTINYTFELKKEKLFNEIFQNFKNNKLISINKGDKSLNLNFEMITYTIIINIVGSAIWDLIKGIINNFNKNKFNPIIDLNTAIQLAVVYSANVIFKTEIKNLSIGENIDFLEKENKYLIPIKNNQSTVIISVSLTGDVSKYK